MCGKLSHREIKCLVAAVLICTRAGNWVQISWSLVCKTWYVKNKMWFKTEQLAKKERNPNLCPDSFHSAPHPNFHSLLLIQETAWTWKGLGLLLRSLSTINNTELLHCSCAVIACEQLTIIVRVMISFWGDCMNCDDARLGSRCLQRFANVALELYFLHVVIFWYILNSCPHTDCIVFKGQNSALLHHGYSETSKGLFSPLLSYCCYIGSEKLGFLTDNGICLYLADTSVWRHRLRTEKRCMHLYLPATLLWNMHFFRINWTQVEVPCSDWEQGWSRCWCVILSVIHLAQWAYVPAQGWGSTASGHSPWALLFLEGSGACTSQTMETVLGRALMQEKRPLGGPKQLCEHCKTCMCLVTNLNMQADGGLWKENEKHLADGMLQPSRFPETRLLQNDGSQGHAKDTWNCMEINPNCDLWQVVWKALVV